MTLNYTPFACNAEVARASRNAPPFRHGSKGHGVRLLQGALIDLGIPLHYSARMGRPDGDFGSETEKAVRTYQTSRQLKVDGVAGKEVISAMDMELFLAKMPPMTALPTPPPYRTGDYKLGTSDPPRQPDPGAGPYDSSPKRASYVAFGMGITASLPVAYGIIGDDAAAHMAHFLANSGHNYRVDLEGMLNEVPSAYARFLREVQQAKTFVEGLPRGRHEFTSVGMELGYSYKFESQNWFYAMGGYQSWGKGVAEVAQSISGTPCEMDFEYKIWDRDNWDSGKAVTIGKLVVTDKVMGELHRQGIAREFDCVGSLHRKFSWNKGSPIPANQLL